MPRLPTNARMSLAHSLRKPVTLARPVIKERFAWTEAADARLAELLATGTASEAARALGTTRNSVIGRAHRQGIPLRPPAGQGDAKAVDQKLAEARRARERERKARAAKERRQRSGARRLADAVPAEHLAKAPPAEPPVTTPMTFVDPCMVAGLCRFAVGEVEGNPRRHLFCAAPTMPGSSYCEHHHSRVYQRGTARGAQAPAVVDRRPTRFPGPPRALEAAE